jgi:hypothetical protein
VPTALPLPVQTKDGKIWTILDGATSEDLIHNSTLLGRTMRIHGCCFRRASSIEMDSYEALGKRYCEKRWQTRN